MYYKKPIALLRIRIKQTPTIAAVEVSMQKHGFEWAFKRARRKLQRKGMTPKACRQLDSLYEEAQHHLAAYCKRGQPQRVDSILKSMSVGAAIQ